MQEALNVLNYVWPNFKIESEIGLACALFTSMSNCIASKECQICRLSKMHLRLMPLHFRTVGILLVGNSVFGNNIQ